MKDKFKKISAVCLGALFALSLSACSSGKQAELKDFYDISYELNYDGAQGRTVSVAAGTNAVSWRPYRQGYVLDGWYTDDGCTSEFDFDTRIDADITLYAAWSKEKEKYTVTFNENSKYSGTPIATVIKSGDRIIDTDVPEITKKGFVLEGWYTEPECSNKWDFDKDTVTKDTALYANFVYDGSIERDADGKPIFDQVNVNVWLSEQSYGTETAVMKIAEDFNKEYEGRIRVHTSTTLNDQSSYSLRLQRNLDRNTSDSYWAASDIFDMAAIDYDASDWYEDAIGDCFLDGKLGSIPLAAHVPYVVYNDHLLTKYGESVDEMRNHYDLCRLLKKVYDGEHKVNSDFNTIVCGKDWAFTQNTSQVAFMQNGAEYFSYAQNGYVNTYSDTSVAENATGALDKMYALLGVNGAYHGKFTENDNKTFEAVLNGNALMGIINWYLPSISIARAINSPSCSVDIMPLSNIFAEAGAEVGARIPVQNIGFSFCNFSSTLSNTELAAAAVFVDYVSKNSIGVTGSCWYPVRKSVVESDMFDKPPKALAMPIDLLKKCGSPKNFYSTAGHSGGLDLIDNTIAQEYILPFMDGDITDAKSLIERMGNVLAGTVAR